MMKRVMGWFSFIFINEEIVKVNHQLDVSVSVSTLHKVLEFLFVCFMDYGAFSGTYSHICCTLLACLFSSYWSMYFVAFILCCSASLDVDFLLLLRMIFCMFFFQCLVVMTHEHGLKNRTQDLTRSWPSPSRLTDSHGTRPSRAESQHGWPSPIGLSGVL